MPKRRIAALPWARSSCLVSQDVMALSSKLLGHVRRKMLRTGLPPVLDDLDEDGTLRPGSTLRPKSVG